MMGVRTERGTRELRWSLKRSRANGLRWDIGNDYSTWYESLRANRPTELSRPREAHFAVSLQGVLDMLATMRDVYRTMTSRRPPASEAGFLRWVLAKGSTDTAPVPPAVSPDPEAENRPDTRVAARSLAEHYVLMARSEALDALGERNAGIRLVENWMRSRE